MLKVIQSNRARCVAGLALWVAASVALVGCGGDSAPEIPATPDGTVKAVAQYLADNNPRAGWEAMPPAWQKDVDGLVDGFADKIDAEVYDKTFAVISKAGDVLKSKKSLIIELMNDEQFKAQSPLDMAEVSKQYDTVVDLVNTIAKSELRTRDGLKSMDIGKFLGGTGSKLMGQMEQLAAAAPGGKADWEKMKANLRSLKVELVDSSDGTATLKITTDGRTEEVQMAKIDGHWVPKDMADGWTMQMNMARAQLDQMSGMVANKAQVMQMLNQLDTGLSAMAKASTKEELQQAAMGMFGAMAMQSGMGGPGGGMGGPRGF